MMLEATGDVLSYTADAIVVPINWVTNKQGHAIMGAGVAKQAANRWPWLPASLGTLIGQTPDVPQLICLGTAMGPYLLNFPTKRDWRQPSNIDLIEQGVQRMVRFVDHAGWQTIALPRLGCGLGQLSWDVQVRPLLADLLDDRFVVVNR